MHDAPESPEFVPFGEAALRAVVRAGLLAYLRSLAADLGIDLARVFKIACVVLSSIDTRDV
jgi:hypothetical protein